MDAHRSAIFAFQFVKPILEIQFWSVKCTTVTVQYAKISSFSIPCHQVIQVIGIIRLANYIYEHKSIQNAFKRI